jgi:2-polyprenyl-3-methyl-5-hydroxy-6-metoxy-1,4-benzoquinol methylase
MFRVRSQEKELLDRDDIPTVDLYQNLRELDFINHWLGGYQISFGTLKKLLKKNHVYTICDIGCGGGDTLKRLHSWSKKYDFQLDLHGIDLKQVCIDYAVENVKEKQVNFICDDYRNIFNHLNKVDIIHACLFCHHLSDEELVELVRFCTERKCILVINDLERSVLAHYAIKILTLLFSKSYLVKNDAPLSVLRGFKKTEWIDMLKRAGAKRFWVKNKWAFRHEVMVFPNS